MSHVCDKNIPLIHLLGSVDHLSPLHRLGIKSSGAFQDQRRWYVKQRPLKKRRNTCCASWHFACTHPQSRIAPALMTHEYSNAVPVRTKEVLEHFLQNPKLVQDLEDVARWRMPHELATLTFDHVRRALMWLVEERFLVKETGQGVAARFRLNKEREADAWSFVADPDWQLYGHTDKEETRRNRLIVLAKTWIDATLVRHLKENPGAAGDQPGLTRSRESAEALFSRAVAKKEKEDVDSARRAAAEASRTLSDALRSAVDEPLAILYHALNLTFPELQAILLCLAPELDADYQTIYGVLNDDMSRRTPTLGLIWINFVHLFMVSLLPFATAWIARTRVASSPVVFYAGLFMCIECKVCGSVFRKYATG